MRKSKRSGNQEQAAITSHMGLPLGALPVGGIPGIAPGAVPGGGWLGAVEAWLTVKLGIPEPNTPIGPTLGP